MSQSTSPLAELLQRDFAGRLVQLHSGALGLRTLLPVEVKDTSTDEEPNTLDFIATDETLDRYDEVIRLDGWDVANYLRNPVVVDSHDYSSISRILGRTTQLTVTTGDDGRMVNRVQFALDNPMGNLAWKMARAGFIKSESVGFLAKEWTNGASADAPSRTFTKAELLEISLVAVPANPGATLAAGLREGAIEKGDVQALVDHLQRFFSEGKTDPAKPPQAADDPTLGRIAGLLRTATERLHRA